MYTGFSGAVTAEGIGFGKFRLGSARFSRDRRPFRGDGYVGIDLPQVCRDKGPAWRGAADVRAVRGIPACRRKTDPPLSRRAFRLPRRVPVRRPRPDGGREGQGVPGVGEMTSACGKSKGEDLRILPFLLPFRERDTPPYFCTHE